MAEYKKKKESLLHLFWSKQYIKIFFKNMVLDNYVLSKEFHFWYNIVLVQFLISYASRWGTILNN